MSSSESKKPDLEWITEPVKDGKDDFKDGNPMYYREDLSFLRPAMENTSTGERVLSLLKDNPLVALGCVSTVGFLLAGLKSFYSENTKTSQLMMRGRVVAQGATVAALLGGALYETTKRRSSSSST